MLSPEVYTECYSCDGNTTLCMAGIDTERGKLSSREVQDCTERIQEMVLSRLNSSVAGKLVSSVNILRDSYTGEGWHVCICVQTLGDMW